MQLHPYPYELLQFSPASLVLTVLAAVIAVVYYFIFIKTRGLPPGPTGLPLLGYWPFLKDGNGGQQLDEMKKKYGDVFSISFTGRLHVNLGTIKSIREAHITNSDCFAERTSGFNMFQELFKDGVAAINGESWKAQRKFFLTLFREYGMTTMKENVTETLYDSIKEILEYLKKSNGEPVNIVELLTSKCTNVLRQTLFGDHGITEEQMLEIIELYTDITGAFVPKIMLLYGKVGRLILHFTPEYQAAVGNVKKVESILFEVVKEQKQTYNEDHMRSIVDEFFRERNKRQEKGDPIVKYFTDKSLVSSLHQFIGDGILTVGGFIGLFVQSLVEYPEEQEKMYEELVEIVGANRDPTLEDKSKLPYTNAFIFEVMRTVGSQFIAIFPSLVCTKETTIQGYRIPKGTVTLMNIFSINHDPETYEDPAKFNPSRFMATENRRRAELPVNFGVGKRACLGEGYSMAQIFLFLSSIVKNFRLLPGNEEDKNLTALEAVVTGKVRVRAILRNKI